MSLAHAGLLVRADTALTSSAADILDGLDPETWAIVKWLPTEQAPIIGNAVSIFVPFWEYCVLFPSEVRIWTRMYRAKPFRWHFAPVMTLILRYLLITFAFADAFTQWSNSNSNATCAVQSVLFVVTNILISTCAVLAMAWRTNAVVRGVIQSRSMRLAVQAVLLLLMAANIAMNWVFLIQAQFTGSWSAYAFHGVCTTKANDEPVGSHPVTDDTEFWYYVVSILFDAYCASTITLALHRLARHSHGFSKLIQQLVLHSVGYLAIILLLMLLGIIWLRVQNAFWAANFIQIIQGAIVVRILMSEQEQAQRPHDTDTYPQSEMADSYPGQSFVSRSGVSYAPPNSTHSQARKRISSSRLSASGRRRGSSGFGIKSNPSDPSQWDTYSLRSSGQAAHTSLSSLEMRNPLSPRHVQVEARPDRASRADPDAILPDPDPGESPTSSPRDGRVRPEHSFKGSEESKDDIMAMALGGRAVPVPVLGKDTDIEAAPMTPLSPVERTVHLQRPPRASDRSLVRHLALVRPGSWTHDIPWEQYNVPLSPPPAWGPPDPDPDANGGLDPRIPTDPLHPPDDMTPSSRPGAEVTVEAFRPDT